MNTDRNRIFLVIFLLFAAVSCGGGEAAPGGAGGGAGAGMPAMAVQIVTLEAKPVEQTTEFVGTVKSRRSTEIQPQVEGFITRITAKPGQRVDAGAMLMEIDSRVPQGQLAGLESDPRAARDRRHLRAAGSGARGQAAGGGRREPDGCRSRGKRAEGGGSATAHRAGTNPHGAHRSRLLPRHRPDRRDRRRHSRPRRRSRDEGDEADDRSTRTPDSRCT